eukprot:962929-Karenia_brevis.AAC.2
MSTKSKRTIPDLWKSRAAQFSQVLRILGAFADIGWTLYRVERNIFHCGLCAAQARPTSSARTPLGHVPPFFRSRICHVRCQHVGPHCAPTAPSAAAVGRAPHGEWNGSAAGARGCKWARHTLHALGCVVHYHLTTSPSGA